MEVTGITVWAEPIPPPICQETVYALNCVLLICFVICAAEAAVCVARFFKGGLKPYGFDI